MKPVAAPSPWSRADGAALALLLCITTLAWCGAFSRWSPAAWALPIRYLEPEYADFIGAAAMVKTIATDGWVPLGGKPVHRLGAPRGADWTPMTTTDEAEVSLYGLFTWIFGLFGGFNLGLLVAHLGTAAAFYVVARIVGAAATWAFVGGLAYGLAPYLFAQSPHHITCQFIAHVPFFVLVWQWISSAEGIPFGSTRFRWSLVIAAVAGMQMPYFTNILCQLTLLGGAVRAWQTRSRSPLVAAGAVVAAAAVGFAFINLDTWVHRLVHAPPGSGAILNREYKWMDIYGLKLVDLFMPYMTHRFDLFAKFGLAHRQASVLNDEEGCAYLGILGGACLLWLFAVSVRALVERRQGDVPAAAWQVLWIVLMFTTGGLNAIIASFTGFTLFRTACRYSVVILLLVLLWAAERLTAWERNAAGRVPAETLRIGGLTVAAAACMLVLWDQVPRAPTAEQTGAIARQVESDREFVRKMEDSLPDGAMVFQLPVMEYSGNAVPGIPPYDHFRPYLYSHDVKFSFGNLPGDPRDAWQMAAQQRLVEGATVDQQAQQIRFKVENVRRAIDEIRKQGFSALYVNRNGFPDRGRGLADALLELGYAKPPIYSTAGDMACILLDIPAGK